MNKSLLGIFIVCIIIILITFSLVDGKNLLFPQQYNNDIIDSILQITPIIFIFAIISTIISIPLFICSLKNEKKHLGINSNAPLERKIVTVIRKRIYSPQGMLSNLHLILFQDETGGRIELAIKDKEEYNLILQGDKGILTHRGKKFIFFERYNLQT